MRADVVEGAAGLLGDVAAPSTPSTTLDSRRCGAVGPAARRARHIDEVTSELGMPGFPTEGAAPPATGVVGGGHQSSFPVVLVG